MTMEEIKIWAIDGSDVTEVQRTDQTESEQWLEDNLVSKPELLIPGLKLVGRQTQTEGGPLDLLGVDSDGRLVVFELKRGTLSRDAVAQIIDYASYLESMNPDALAGYIAARSGENGIEKIEDFGEWHAENTEAESLDSLLPLRAFLVGLGVDDRTQRMVNFLAKNGMGISLLTFYGFAHQGKTLLVKQVEVEGTLEVEPRPARRRTSRAERQADFDRRVDIFGIRNLVDSVRKMFKDYWPESRERIGAHGLRVQIPEGHYRQYARIDPWSKGTVGLVFFPRAKALCLDEFRLRVKVIPYQTWPPDKDPIGDARSEIQFRLNEDVWETNKKDLAALVRVVYESREDG